MKNLEIRKLTPTIGAEIANVDIGSAIDDATFQAIHQALMDHCVVFFRNQDVSPPSLRDFASRFGQLNIHPYLPKVENIPELIVLENDRDRPPAVNLWHTDLTYLPEPPLGAVLYAHILPPTGGDTMWANMYAAYEALSSHTRSLIDGLKAVHEVDFADYAKALGDKVKLEQGGRRSAEHPVVRTHPVTGRRSLFVNSASTKNIKGMSSPESQALLQMLFRHAETPEFQVRFHWEPRSIAIWDNRCTQHYALADYWPERRVMFRAAIEGDRPH